MEDPDHGRDHGKLWRQMRHERTKRPMPYDGQKRTTGGEMGRTPKGCTRKLVEPLICFHCKSEYHFMNRCEKKKRDEGLILQVGVMQAGNGNLREGDSDSGLATTRI